MKENDAAAGLSERILREVIATPAFKELMILQMKDIKAETAPGLVKTLLWGDPGISMSLFGALPDAVNWLLEFLLELGRQLNSLPEPLLKDILGQIGTGIESERLREFPAIYGQLVRRILVGEDKSPEEVRAAVIAALNTALAGLDNLTVRLEENRADIARSLSEGAKSIDTATLARSMRRIGLVALAAARPPGEKTGDRKSAGKTAGAVIALLAVLVVFKKIRSR